MNTTRPDIVVLSPDGEYLVIVEVKLNDSLSYRQSAIDQLKQLMAFTGCSMGLAVAGKNIFLLRDSLEKAQGESIAVVGEATLPDHLLPSADEQWKGTRAIEFELRVQRWLEHLQEIPTLEALPNDLRELLEGSLINLLRLGEIRAAGPRWSRVAS